MKKSLYIIIIFSFSFSLNLFTEFSSFIIGEQIIEEPFLGGMNKPRVQWVDWDNDSDDDLFLLDEDGRIKYFKNNSDINYDFNLITTSFKDISNISWFYFGDFDNDGDIDLITQDPNNLNNMLYYSNELNDLALLDNIIDNNGEPINSDAVMVPTFADIDNDNDLDFFTGNAVGTVTFYENIGFENNIPLFEFSTNYWEEIYIVGSSREQRHGASAITFIDLDNDNDLDLTWGDYFQQSLYVIWNVGDINNPNMNIENIVQQFPLNDPVLTAGLNMPSFSDIDKDGDKDLFVTVLSGAYGYQLINNFILYEMQNDFLYTTSNFIESLDVLSDINPVFCDIDSDGDSDLFIGTDFDPTSVPWTGKVKMFNNIGIDEQGEPIWSLEDDDLLNDDVGHNLAPFFADIDFDEDYDLFIGNFNGNVEYYENIGNKYSHEYLYSENISNIDLSGYSVPSLIDIDNDEDLDLIVGNMTGSIFYYENVGDKFNYDFQLITNNYHDINVNYRSNPKFYDYDLDNDLDLFVGTGDEGIIYYENIGSFINPEYIVTDDLEIPKIGYNVSPVIYLSNDITGLMAGVSTGGMYFIPFESNSIGDLNSDDIVNIFDIIILIECILFDDYSNLSFFYLDVNVDGEVNIVDVIYIVNVILNNSV